MRAGLHSTLALKLGFEIRGKGGVIFHKQTLGASSGTLSEVLSVPPSTSFQDLQLAVATGPNWTVNTFCFSFYIWTQEQASTMERFGNFSTPHWKADTAMEGSVGFPHLKGLHP